MKVRRVSRVAMKQVERVSEQIDDGFERIACAVGTAGQVQDDTLPADAAQPATEYCEASFLPSGRTHQFRDTVNEAIADFACGFGRDVTRGDPGATKKNNKDKKHTKKGQRL